MVDEMKLTDCFETRTVFIWDAIDAIKTQNSSKLNPCRCVYLRDSVPHRSKAVPCCRHRLVPHSWHLHYMIFQAIQTTYFLKALGPRISKLILPSVSYSNTQIHIYSILRSARKTQQVVYFWKEDCSEFDPSQLDPSSSLPSLGMKLLH